MARFAALHPVGVIGKHEAAERELCGDSGARADTQGALGTICSAPHISTCKPQAPHCSRPLSESHVPGAPVESSITLE
eukprot:g945.t1